MSPLFRLHVESLQPALERLINMPPCQANPLPREVQGSGVYLFSETTRHLYVGRSDKLRRRLQLHCQLGAGHGQAAFAFRLARAATGSSRATYRHEGSRRELEAYPAFAEAFRLAKDRIRLMDIRFVEEANPIRQATSAVRKSPITK